MSGFGEQLKMGDGFSVELSCDHEFTGGSMKCSKCGKDYQVKPVNFGVSWTDSTVDFTSDGLK